MTAISLHCDVSQLNLVFKNKAELVTKWRQAACEKQSRNKLSQWSDCSHSLPRFPVLFLSTWMLSSHSCVQGAHQHLLWLVWMHPETSWLGQGAELYPLFLQWGAFISSLASPPVFPKAPEHCVVLRPESLTETNIGIAWGEAEREALVGMRKLCCFWKSRLQHNKIASIYVHYESSQGKIGFLIIWQTHKNRAATDHANELFRKNKAWLQRNQELFPFWSLI